MPDTANRGYTYPASTAHTRLWELFQELATDIDTDVAAVSAAVTAKSYVVLKAASESVTSSTTLQDDDELLVALGVGIWRVEAKLFVSGAAASDVKIEWTFTGTATGTQGRLCRGPAAGTTDPSSSAVMKSSFHAVTTSVIYGLDVSATAAIEEDMIWNVSAAGTLTMIWAQNVSGATATTVNAGCRLYVTKVG